MKGRIIKHVSGFYYVDTGEHVWKCRGRGIFKLEGITPLVGDMAEIEVTHEGDSEGIVNEILPRKNSFVRPPAANVDRFLIVCAAARPKPVFEVIDRFLVMAEHSDTSIILCITKKDLDKKGKIDEIKKIYGGLYPVYCTSSITGEGTVELADAVSEGLTALAGPSGAGKSTLLNILCPDAAAETGDISRKTSRGRNTTRHVELFSLPGGGMIFDTPGFTAIDVADTDEIGLQNCMPEIARYRADCRYDDCMHLKEPDCAVRRAVEEGKISESRYASYRQMIDEIRKKKKY